MKNWSVTLTVPILATRPTSLRPRSSSIRCSARSFGSASSSSSSALSSCGVAPRGRVPAIGRIVTVPSRTPHQNFRARAGDGEAAEIEEVEKRRRVDPPQRAIERERRQRERRLEALRQHHLEDIAGQRCIPWPSAPSPDTRPGVVLDFAGTSSGPARCPLAALSSGRSSASTTPTAARSRARERGLGVDAGLRPHRRDHGDARPSPRRTPRSASGGSARRRECRSDRDGRRAVPPSAAPCRSRDSRTRRPPSAAARRAARCGFRRSARAALRAAAAGRARRPIGLRPRVAIDLGARRRWSRQIRSGSSPMTE